jgi:hypothetical protein
VFDSGACGTIAVPPLDPNITNYPDAPPATTVNSTINYKGLLPLINQIVYAGEFTANPSGGPTGVTANLAQSPNNAAQLPAPNCDQQGNQPFQGQSLQYPHVNESSNANP